MLEVVDIHKNFRGVHALKGVSTAFFNKEIHGLVGENGAGKSTLMKIISGMYPPNKGELHIDGESLKLKNPREAYIFGIRIVHQELSLIKSLSVAENIFIHKFKEGKFTKQVNRKQLENQAQKMLDEWDIQVDVKEKVSHVPMGVRQLVEIARELSSGGRIIILDEPTSSLTNTEIEKLFTVMKKLKKSDIITIFTSHRLSEIIQIVDRITVLRDGEMVGTSKTEELNSEQICTMIAGTDIASLYPKENASIGSNALEVKNFSGPGYRNIDITVRWGEIVGLAGLVGAGRSELCRGIFGIDRHHAGELFINGERVEIKSAKKAVDKDIALLGEDRGELGLFPELNVGLNTIILKIKNAVRAVFVSNAKIAQIANDMANKLRITTYDPMKQKIIELSGGNQQKVLFARLLATNPKILILDEPTKGVDIQNKTEIHKIMGEFVKNGGAVLMVSSELEEVIGISDRVYVLHESDIVGEFSRSDFKKEKILKSMMGLTK